MAKHLWGQEQWMESYWTFAPICLGARRLTSACTVFLTSHTYLWVFLPAYPCPGPLPWSQDFLEIFQLISFIMRGNPQDAAFLRSLLSIKLTQSLSSLSYHKIPGIFMGWHRVLSEVSQCPRLRGPGGKMSHLLHSYLRRRSWPCDQHFPETEN